MIETLTYSAPEIALTQSNKTSSERGAALVAALLMLALMSAIAMTVLSVVSTEAKIAGSDLARTNTCYASAAGIEKMTSDFSSLFNHTSRPTDHQLYDVEQNYPTELTGEGYAFSQSVKLDTARLTEMGTNPKVTIPSGPFGGLIANLAPYKLKTTATSSIAQCNLEREMNNYLIPLFQFGMFSDKDIELHPGPAFTFNGRVHANGNIYVNGNVTFLAKVTTANEFIYDVLRNGSERTGASVKMKVGAITVPITKGSMDDGPNIPTATASPAGQRGYFPGSPDGSINTSWNSTSVAAATTGVANKFGGQLLTRTTGAAPLKLPLQLDGNSTRELIKRTMPNDSPDPLTPTSLGESRYHSKAAIRILIDDEAPATADASGIPANQGVTLSAFNPIPLPNATPSASPTANGGGRALWRVNDNNTSVSNSYFETTTTYVQQAQNGTARQADTVRSAKSALPVKTITNATKTTPISITATAHGFQSGDTVVISGVGGNTAANGTSVITVVNANTFTLNGKVGNNNYTSGGTVYNYSAIPKSPNGTVIPFGAGITGRILIQIVDSNGVVRDVTKEILSMGMTVGEPNAIVHLQRPLWAAFTQGSRDSSTASPTPNPVLNGDPKYSNSLTDLINLTHVAADGEIDTANATQDAYGYLKVMRDDTAPSSQPLRPDLPQILNVNSFSASMWNSIVPINVYNVREGHLRTALAQNAVYERGITQIVELNMKNLARWMNGVYDRNLLATTNAVSTNIARPDGYIVYVSDRRGDRVRALVDSTGNNLNSTNGMADNEDIYGPNGNLNPGEDVQGTGVLVKEIEELLDSTTALAGTSGADAASRNKRALTVAAWTNLIGGTGADANNHKYFRGAVRLFNGENLQNAGVAANLSTTLGITVASENMAYIWGNYNTTGINQAPTAGSATLNDPASASRYTGNQVPTSIVCDAFFPLSKTWFDGLGALYPDEYTQRSADFALPGVTSETSVRAAIIAGNNLSALLGAPDAGNGNDSRLSGGLHNFPRFMEDWLSDGRRWNFVGSFVPLYYSTQALGPWWYIQTNGDSLYGAPVRNWAFDSTFLQGDRLPPGTPMFQYIEPTAFRQVLY